MVFSCCSSPPLVRLKILGVEDEAVRIMAKVPELERIRVLRTLKVNAPDLIALLLERFGKEALKVQAFGDVELPPENMERRFRTSSPAGNSHFGREKDPEYVPDE